MSAAARAPSLTDEWHSRRNLCNESATRSGARSPGSVLIGVDPVLCRPVHDTEGLRAHYGIRRSVFVEEQGVFPESDVDAHDARDDVLHVLAFHDGRPAGTVRLYPKGPGEWLGDRLAVLPEFRSAHIGVPLVRFAVATASARGGRIMQAHVQMANERFFQRLGWTTAGPMKTYVGHPHIPMSIPLTPVCPWLTGPSQDVAPVHRH